ncbi:MAG: VWA domain-containing protein [Meiothermus sp.]|uniref:vWA domain-containing protein n=1 Tax=Meiothermus sp. TaxID=1955249 RepID=UPI0028CDAAFE|nr:VWA domain-containing protein [Meiothermus sp.]MDT7920031.1 VWA domain-containing protein [Meiothermus sp.]
MRVRYSKYEPGFDDLTGADLMDMIQDFLMDSGFSDPYNRYQPDPDRTPTAEDLYDALLQALLEQGRIPEEWLREARFANRKEETRLYREIQKLIQRLQDEGYIRLSDAETADQGMRGEAQDTRLELTNKSVDFLGLKSLRTLLGSLGKNAPGAHVTRHFASGVESSGETKPYEFGDQPNINIGETLKQVVMKGLENIEERDLTIELSEYTAAMNTVVLLDCSHSMILYGEDRFTPAKRVALGLAHLIRTQYPGDQVRFGVFHDSAEEVPLGRLPTVQVGPYHTNTAEGLRLARKMLKKMSGEMKQIIMITDGKPSALTLPSGQIYKNAWGLDPVILAETLKEATLARKEGIPIHTFMLAREPELLAFVKKLTQITKGKAYLTTPGNIGRYVLMDFLNRKVSRN